MAVFCANIGILTIPFIAGDLCYSSGSGAVLFDGSFLLDARRGNLPLLVCCKSLQRQQQDENLSRSVMGYV